MSDEKADPELKAIGVLLDTLGPLDPEARKNVLGYVFKRLGIDVGSSEQLNSGQTTDAHQSRQRSNPAEPPSPVDIRSFRQAKNPKNASEMVALVGYYLAHLAPQDERRDAISAGDIKKYFHQADFPLPVAPGMALVHAKNAGYLDSRERGQYRLNPVGHNLVAHRLPSADKSAAVRSSKRKPQRQRTPKKPRK